MIVGHVCGKCSHMGEIWIPKNAIRKDEYGRVIHKAIEIKCPVCDNVEDVESIWKSIYETQSREEYERKEYDRLKKIYG
ncbi:hypothetical protein PQE75_gp143 [Bacillus phage vB_BcoS-136]|uniref:Uncharacterized protein n=1 Tax=Bacillus phage vB_BcoS-136 TaxID=2419619 RepID=A0A3G3BW55_9CAUD|nr:hypothetical protein PQE75_gp143 [Bacillus phage vB_BcoS-136]AYP68336.1 hypothetical protein vBBcoS136_00222 [Bacillus phage vB_BcoS-136]